MDDEKTMKFILGLFIAIAVLSIATSFISHNVRYSSDSSKGSVAGMAYLVVKGQPAEVIEGENPTTATSDTLPVPSTSGGGSVGSLGTISGSGTAGQIPKFIAPRKIGNSIITEKNGKVGIGTTNPEAKLEIYDKNSSFLWLKTGDNGGAMIIAGTPQSNFAAINLQGMFGSELGFLKILPERSEWLIGFPTPDTKDLSITGAKSGSFSPFLTVQQETGNVGIGTTEPQAKLHVADGDALFEKDVTVMRMLVVGEDMRVLGDHLELIGDADLVVQKMQGNGNAYACVDNMGRLFRSNSTCI